MRRTVENLAGGSVILVLGLCILTGCSRVVVTSDPPGATVLYSTNGLAPWKNWPPHENPASPSNQTPLRSLGFYRDYYFLKVEKPGYHPVKPVLLDLTGTRRVNVHFDLAPTPELFAMQQRAKGLIFFEGEWVDPKERGLVQYENQWMTSDERFQREQQAKGLVLFEGQWMSPEDRDRAFAQEQMAKGLVYFKQRWLTPQDVETEIRIDARVEELLRASRRRLASPVVVGRLPDDKVQLRVLNGTGQQLHFFEMGPASSQQVFDPYESHVVSLSPGPYSVVAYQAKSGDIETTGAALGDLVGLAHAQISLEKGYQYSMTYEGPALLAQDIDQILSSIDQPTTYPSIVIPSLEDFTTTPSLPKQSDRPTTSTQQDSTTTPTSLRQSDHPTSSTSI